MPRLQMRTPRLAKRDPGKWESRDPQGTDPPGTHTRQDFPPQGRSERAASLPDHLVLCLATVADAEIHTEGEVVAHLSSRDPAALEKEVPWPDAAPPQRPCQPHQIKCSPPLPSYSPSSPFCRQAAGPAPSVPSQLLGQTLFST